jgi:hypothetical protein
VSLLGREGGVGLHWRWCSARHGSPQVSWSRTLEAVPAQTAMTTRKAISVVRGAPIHIPLAGMQERPDKLLALPAGLTIPRDDVDRPIAAGEVSAAGARAAVTRCRLQSDATEPGIAKALIRRHR